MSPPSLVVIAGPNGAGKSTLAPALLRDTLSVQDYVNADAIAHGLSAFRPDRAAVQAGRVALERLHQLADRGESFAFESTLEGRSLARFILSARGRGYRFHLTFLWLPSAEMAVARVQERVRSGGHAVPDDVVRRRYRRGLTNFLGLYRPLADWWRVYDSSLDAGPRLVAQGANSTTTEEVDPGVWRRIMQHADA